MTDKTPTAPPPPNSHLFEVLIGLALFAGVGFLFKFCWNTFAGSFGFHVMSFGASFALLTMVYIVSRVMSAAFLSEFIFRIEQKVERVLPFLIPPKQDHVAPPDDDRRGR